MKHISFGAFQTTSKASFLVWIKKARRIAPQCRATSQNIDEGRQLGTQAQAMVWSFSELCLTPARVGGIGQKQVDFSDLWRNRIWPVRQPPCTILPQPPPMSLWPVQAHCPQT